MKNPEKILERLIEIALEHYHAKAKPDCYATTAAHIVAKASAAEFSHECADAAAFIAATQDAENRLALAKYSAGLAEAAAKRHDAEKNYRARAKIHAGKAARNEEEREVSFADTIEEINQIHIKQSATDIYNKAYKENAQQALNAACINYPYAYASARSAYVYAAAVAARYPEGIKRTNVFKHILTQRLTKDLTHQPIEPSFFMQIICSEAMKLFAILVLIVGLGALSLGITGLAVASVGSVLISMGMTSAATTITGAAMSSIGTGLFTARFFTHRQWEQKK